MESIGPASTFTSYNLDDLRLLEQCVKDNDSLMSALRVFFDASGKNPSWHEAIELWGRKAEAIKGGQSVDQFLASCQTNKFIETKVYLP